MSKVISEKKISLENSFKYFSENKLSNHFNAYNFFFKVHRYDNRITALNYAKGLLICEKGKANMERIEEETDSEYRAYQHFISNSKWDYEGLQNQIAQDTSEIFQKQSFKNKQKVGYIIDESAHIKKGNNSVGVSRQYAGVIGKIDNCQVGVYASLVNGYHTSIINQRLFLPDRWIDDKSLCAKVGIPEKKIQKKTKPQLALEMLKEDISRGVKFDWIGGDGLYGHNLELCRELESLKQFYVLDVHNDENVYLEETILEVPKQKSGRGRKPIKKRPNNIALTLKNYAKSLSKSDWKLEKVRKGTKGLLYMYVHKKEVWIWDKESSEMVKRVVIITRKKKEKKLKYSITNGAIDEYSYKEYAYFVAQRYWVERAFQNNKQEIGLSDYQVRKWESWHKHHAIVMLTSLFLVKQLMIVKDISSLISFRDARIMNVLQICKEFDEQNIRLNQMAKRHIKRQMDIDRAYKKQMLKI